MARFIPASAKVKELAAMFVKLGEGYTATEFMGAMAIASVVYAKHHFPHSTAMVLSEHKQNLDMAFRTIEDQE